MSFPNGLVSTYRKTFPSIQDIRSGRAVLCEGVQQGQARARSRRCGWPEPDRGRRGVPEDGALYQVDSSTSSRDDRYPVWPDMTEKLPLSHVEVAADCFPRRFLLSASIPTGVFLRAVPIGEFVIGAATTTSSNASASGSKYKVIDTYLSNQSFLTGCQQPFSAGHHLWDRGHKG